MKIGLNMVLAAGLGLAAVQLPARAEDKPAFKDDREKASYAVGMYFGNLITNQIKRSGLELDMDVVMATVKDQVAGHEMRLTEQQGREAISAYQKEHQRLLAEKSKKEGEAFLAENKTKEGVKTKMVTLPDGTTAELQYKVLSAGTGEMPKSNDTVAVNYTGRLVNGKEFDSSSKHTPPGQTNQPSKFPVTGVVKGWTEALQMMNVGSKWELYIPSALAYGDNGRPPTIDPGSTLIFDMELVGIEPPPPPPTPPQPLTSDIIKVPSAEELKKGAKIEVLKPEEAARQAQAEAAKQAAADAAKAPKKQ
jgi:FKBP-type peptidyl-prolyl cis-trans isomerase FklB